MPDVVSYVYKYILLKKLNILNAAVFMNSAKSVEITHGAEPCLKNANSCSCNLILNVFCHSCEMLGFTEQTDNFQ
jgi:hypothetical protein